MRSKLKVTGTKNGLFKNIFSILLFCLFPCFLSGIAAQSSTLFPIKENSRYGFIDQKGIVTVKPKFIAITPFSEGLAAVREKGHYGYIDASGEYVISPIYDYGESFQEGKAVVYKDGQPYFINKSGKLLFGDGYVKLFPFKEGRAKVKTKSEKYGVVDTLGILLIDTLFEELTLLDNGLALVEGAYSKDEYGIIDGHGQFIVPYGQFESIKYLGSNRYEVIYEDPEKEETVFGVIDNSGQLLFSYEEKGFSVKNRFYNGLAAVYIERFDTINNKEISYGGYINTDGEIIIQDTLFDEFELGRFAGEYAIVTTKNKQEIIIDQQGTILGEGLYNHVEGTKFRYLEMKAGLFIVSKDGDFFILDDYEASTLLPKTMEVKSLRGKFIFFYEKNDRTGKVYYGIAQLDGTIILSALLDYFDPSGFQNGLLACKMQGRLTYVNEKGVTVWQERESLTENDAIVIPSIDYKLESDYFVKSIRSVNERIREEFMSKYRPKPINELSDLKEKGLEIIIKEEEKHHLRRILVINNSDINSTFPSKDSRLYMRLQAKDTNDQWQDIEYLPSSWCLNSYHSVVLPANKYWAFSMPLFQGVFSTQLRVALDYNTKSPMTYQEELATIYSDTFEGSVNPGQMWREVPIYYDTMHPYNQFGF